MNTEEKIQKLEELKSQYRLFLMYSRRAQTVGQLNIERYTEALFDYYRRLLMIVIDDSESVDDLVRTCRSESTPFELQDYLKKIFSHKGKELYTHVLLSNVRIIE